MLIDLNNEIQPFRGRAKRFHDLKTFPDFFLEKKTLHKEKVPVES